jgi:inorganic triphosphatase YgiF
MFSLLVGTIAAITVFVILLVKWNSTLENEAKKKAQQLYESERKASETVFRRSFRRTSQKTSSFPGLLVDYASQFQTTDLKLNV